MELLRLRDTAIQASALMAMRDSSCQSPGMLLLPRACLDRVRRAVT